MVRIQNYLVGDYPTGAPAGPGGVPPAIPPSFWNRRVLVGCQYVAGILKSAPPLIVLCPKGGKAAAEPNEPGRDQTPRVLRSSEAHFEAYFWGKDYDQAEMLEASVLSACFIAMNQPSAYIDSDQWLDSQQDSAGELLVAQFRVTGFFVPQIALPLGHPIDYLYDTTATIIAPAAIDDPSTPSGTILYLPVEFPT